MGREVKRVAMDFDWPLKKVWDGYINPHYVHRHECGFCKGSGGSVHANELRDKWYGYVPFSPEMNGSTPFTPDMPEILGKAKWNCRESNSSVKSEAVRLCRLFNGSWSHNLNDDDVKALVDGERLHDLTHDFVPGEGWKKKEPFIMPTAEQVNRWSIVGFGHDCINQWIVCRAVLERLGLPHECEHCNGEGSIWESEEAKTLCEAWKPSEPPNGDGWQMWETTSEGSPISPVFASPEDLASWLASNGASSFGSLTASYDEWLAMIMQGWAISAVACNGELVYGVEACSRM